MDGLKPEVRKRVYIAGPISRGNLLDNVAQADHAMHLLMKAGFAPFNPMLSVYAGGCVSFHEGDDCVNAVGTRGSSLEGTTHDDWLGMDESWVSVSHAVLRLSGESRGADREVAFAHTLGIPVFNAGLLPDMTTELVVETMKHYFSNPV